MFFSMSYLTLKKFNNVSFGVTISPTGYSKRYEQMNPNGTEPDKLVLKALHYYFPDPKQVDVVDIGAGDGRNALTIAKEGYSVTASEICPEAIGKLQVLKQLLNLDKLTIKSENIINRVKQKVKQFDFAFMSHVTQHFNCVDLRIAMLNLNKQVKEKGIVVFDALVRKSGYENFQSTQQDEIYGSAHFCLDDILRIAAFSGFKILGVFDDKINEYNGGKYLHEGIWGKGKEKLNRPIDLKWFVFQKNN